MDPVEMLVIRKATKITHRNQTIKTKATLKAINCNQFKPFCDLEQQRFLRLYSVAEKTAFRLH